MAVMETLRTNHALLAADVVGLGTQGYTIQQREHDASATERCNESSANNAIISLPYRQCSMCPL